MLRLRPFRRDDAKTIITWTKEKEEFYKWSAGLLGSFPVSEEKMLEAVKKRDYSDRYFPFVAFDEDGLVGFFTMRTPNDDLYAMLGYVIISPDKRGHGYGKEMLRLGLKFAFEIYGANIANLGVFENNMNAYHCYYGLGFRETGEKIDFDIEGENWIDIEMEIRKEDYYGNQKNY